MGAWDERQIKDFAKRVRKRAGDGWAWMTPAVREALVAREVVSIIGAQSHPIDPDEVMGLFQSVCETARIGVAIEV